MRARGNQIPTQTAPQATRRPLWRAVVLTALAIPMCFVSPLHGVINVPGIDGEKKSEDKEFTPLPPLTFPVKTEVKQGQSVRITLKTQQRGAKDYEYEIASPPRLGSLSGIMRADATTAVVVYTHGGGSAPALDSFQYTTRSPRSGVSARSTVEIRILDPPPVAELPKSIDFGTAYDLEPQSGTVTLRNAGGGRLAGSLSLPSPWRVEPDTEFSLGAGESAEFHVILEPDGFRTFSGVLSTNTSPQAATTLSATRTPPYNIPTQSITFENNTSQPSLHDTSQPSPRITVESKAPFPVDLAISSPDWIDLAEVATLLPGETLILSPKRARDSGTDFAEDDIRIAGAGVSHTIRATRLAAPARIEAPQLVELPAVGVSRQSSAEFKLTNSGARPARCTLSIAPPYLVEPDTLNLEPGESRTVRILLYSKSPGRFEKPLRVEWDGQSLAPTVVGLVTEQEEVAASWNSGETGSIDAASAAPRINRFLPAPPPRLGPGAKLVAIDGPSAILEFSPVPESSSPVLESRSVQLSKDRKSIQYAWNPWKNARTLERIGQTLRMQVNDLQPASVYLLRLNAESRGFQPRAIMIRTATKQTADFPVVPLLATATFILAGVAAWKRFRRHSPDYS